MEVKRVLEGRNTQPIGPIGEQSSKPIVPIANWNEGKVKLTKEEVLGCDIALSQYSDIMHPDFYKWYCKAWYLIGRERFHELASEARADARVNPARLFSSILKKELAKHEYNAT